MVVECGRVHGIRATVAPADVSGAIADDDGVPRPALLRAREEARQHPAIGRPPEHHMLGTFRFHELEAAPPDGPGRVADLELIAAVEGLTPGDNADGEEPRVATLCHHRGAERRAERGQGHHRCQHSTHVVAPRPVGAARSSGPGQYATRRSPGCHRVTSVRCSRPFASRTRVARVPRPPPNRGIAWAR